MDQSISEHFSKNLKLISDLSKSTENTLTLDRGNPEGKKCRSKDVRALPAHWGAHFSFPKLLREKWRHFHFEAKRSRTAKRGMAYRSRKDVNLQADNRNGGEKENVQQEVSFVWSLNFPVVS